jgi:hypothetical protein
MEQCCEIGSPMAKPMYADGIAGQERKPGHRKLYIESQAHKCLHYR